MSFFKSVVSPTEGLIAPFFIRNMKTPTRLGSQCLFQVDTGCVITHIPRQYAQDAGCKFFKSFIGTTTLVNGQRECVPLTVLKLSPAWHQECIIETVVQVGNAGLKGLLGTNSLMQSSASIGYRNTGEWYLSMAKETMNDGSSDPFNLLAMVKEIAEKEQPCTYEEVMEHIRQNGGDTGGISSAIYLGRSKERNGVMTFP